MEEGNEKSVPREEIAHDNKEELKEVPVTDEVQDGETGEPGQLPSEDENEEVEGPIESDEVEEAPEEPVIRRSGRKRKVIVFTDLDDEVFGEEEPEKPAPRRRRKNVHKEDDAYVD